MIYVCIPENRCVTYNKLREDTPCRMQDSGALCSLKEYQESHRHLSAEAFIDNRWRDFYIITPQDMQISLTLKMVNPTSVSKIKK